MRKINGAWRIIDLKAKRQVSLLDGRSIAFGNKEFAEIEVENGRKIAAQVVGEFGTIFVKQNGSVKSYIDNVTITFFEKSFYIEASSFEEALNDLKLSEQDIATIFGDNNFKFMLAQVRQESMNDSRFEALDVVPSQLSVAKKAINYLNLFFWREHDPFIAPHRKLFVTYIWSCTAQICGYGPLTSLIKDTDISEIMVTNYKNIFIEKHGKIRKTDLVFACEADLLAIIERLVAETGRRVDENHPYCDARMIDGSRLHVILPPLALRGGCVTIRKFPSKPLDAPALLCNKSIDNATMQFLIKAVQDKQNILICGGTGSGKTTFLNVLSDFIGKSERIITIEDSAELQLSQPHVIKLEARHPNSDGHGEVTLRDLVKNALRMRPDRIIVGECRGAEALDMLQSMNTGHRGSLTTIHANSSRDALHRLEVLVMFANTQLPHVAIREQIAAAIDYVVHIERINEARVVTCVCKVEGLSHGDSKYELTQISEFIKDKCLWLHF